MQVFYILQEGASVIDGPDDFEMKLKKIYSSEQQKVLKTF